jgi:hypothetical protein
MRSARRTLRDPASTPKEIAQAQKLLEQRAASREYERILGPQPKREDFPSDEAFSAALESYADGLRYMDLRKLYSDPTISARVRDKARRELRRLAVPDRLQPPAPVPGDEPVNPALERFLRGEPATPSPLGEEGAAFSDLPPAKAKRPSSPEDVRTCEICLLPAKLCEHYGDRTTKEFIFRSRKELHELAERLSADPANDKVWVRFITEEKYKRG